MFSEMVSQSLRTHAETVQQAYPQALSRATRSADPSWFAWQGYVVGSGGREGAGHLAWERIAVRHRAIRERTGRRGLDDRRLAFALGYALGLADHGQTTSAEASRLADVFFPPPTRRNPVYSSSRFWLFVSLVFTFAVSQVAAAGLADSDYPTLSEPLFGIGSGPPPDASAASPAPPAAPVDPRSAASDGVAFEAAIAELHRLPPGPAAALAADLLVHLPAKARCRLINVLAPMPDDRIGAVIRQAFLDGDVTVVETAVAAVVGRGDRHTAHHVAGLLRHSEARVRRLAAESLGVIGSRATAWVLLGSLHDESREVRQAARSALTLLVGKDLGPKLRPWRAWLQKVGS